MSVTLTPAAAKRVGWIAERQGKPAVLRLSVEGGGCSGFQYRFDLAAFKVENPNAAAGCGCGSSFGI
jgi:iron-sulfur cluster insertion protein